MFIGKRNSEASSTMVPYTTLLENLHLPKALYEEATCPVVCGQKQNCHRIRETMSLVDLIVAELGKRNKVLENIKFSMIGSTREGSRAFYNDEVNVHLSLSDDLNNYCFFELKEQDLKRRDPGKDKMHEDLTKYFDDRNIFQCGLYFHDFVASVHAIISNLELPEDFTMNCPTWPTHTRFNGSSKDYAKYLMRERFVGWLEEFSKLENMTGAQAGCSG